MKQIVCISIFYLVCSIGFSQQTLLFSDTTLPKPPINEKIKSWNEHQPNFNKLKQKAKDFYYWVNFSRANPSKFYKEVVLPIVNIYPQLKGNNLNSLVIDLQNTGNLPLLSLSDTLIKMSQAHAIDITEHNSKPSHNSTNGLTFGQRFMNLALKNCGSENISSSGGDGDPLFMLVLLYLDINVQNLGHRKTLLDPKYVLTGIGASYYKNGDTFIVEDFACSQN
ncbi:MAG: CAP domain-containing protein [Bacteroidetes bacterium]|nr:CAP domain-containing protein [Bacteroidota bacterium]